MKNMHCSSYSRNRFQQPLFREKSGDRQLTPIKDVQNSKLMFLFFTSFFPTSYPIAREIWEKKHRYEFTCWVRFITHLDLTKALSGIRTTLSTVVPNIFQEIYPLQTKLFTIIQNLYNQKQHD